MALSDNQVAYYKFDADNSNDAVGSANGTDTSMAYGSSYGKIGHGAYFAGGSSTDFIRLPSTVYSIFSGNQQYTINAWIKFDTLPTVNGAQIFNTYNAGSSYKNEGVRLFINPTPRIDAYRSDGTNLDEITGSSSFTTGVWYMVTMTYDGSNIRVYFNGASDATAVASTRSADSATGSIIGDEQTAGSVSPNTRFVGEMDEIGFWSRALSGAEIASLYNSGAGSQYPYSVSVTATPSVLSSTFSIPAPTVTAIRNVTVAPSVLAATFSTKAPTITGTATVSPSVLAATFSIPAPNIITPDALVNASVLSASFSLPSATISAGAIVSAGVLSATFSQPSATFRGDFTALPSALSATFSIPAPTISAIGNVTVSPSAVAATFSIPSPTVTAEQNAMISAGVLSATFSIPAITVTAIQNVTVSATTLVATFSIPKPLRKVGGLWTAQPREEGVWTPQARAI